MLIDVDPEEYFTRKVEELQDQAKAEAPGIVIKIRTGVTCRQVKDDPGLHNLQLSECGKLLWHSGKHSWEI